MDSAGDVDRISALPDDLLHLILGFLPDATAVSRTAVLSRRWRRVWIHAHGLALLETEVRCPTVITCRFAGFVDWVFAQRGDGDIGSLKIVTKRPYCTSPERVNEWIRYAMQHVVNSFSLHLPSSDGPTHGIDRPVIVLPSHGRAISIWMSLSRYTFQLPGAAKYKALTTLRLSKASFTEVATGGCTLGDFVSSCPRLRKLEIENPIGLAQLVLRAEALEELHVFSAKGLRTLDVTTPKLRILRLTPCFQDNSRSGSNNNTINKVIRVVAPALEELGIKILPHGRRSKLDIQNLASVRRLSDLQLTIVGPYYHDMDAGLWLLENCPGVEHVDVSLKHFPLAVPTSDFVNLMLEDIPSFANVRSMSLEARLFPRRHLVASISLLLLRFPRLKALCIKFTDTGPDQYSRNCFCHDLDAWRSNKIIFLERLGKVKISGFTGAIEEMDLLSLLFEGSNSIKSVTLSATTDVCAASLKRMLGEEEEEDRMDMVNQELMKIPRTDHGFWHFGEDVYTWRATQYDR